MKKILIICLVLMGCGQGPQGVQGPAGTNGTNGTSPTMVQFCTDVVGHYGTFPEYGECLGGNIFAVYWDGKNAWLAEVYPGNYESTATGLQCNFTVGTNCSVTDY
jgi:hypothetical protein